MAFLLLSQQQSHVVLFMIGEIMQWKPLIIDHAGSIMTNVFRKNSQSPRGGTAHYRYRWLLTMLLTDRLAPS